MSDYWWPRSIKPLTNRDYSFSRGSNVLDTQVQGGPSRVSLDATLEPVVFNINIIVSQVGMQAFLNFYDVTLNHGANSFKMMLDSGTGIVEHQCRIVPNTFKTSRPSLTSWQATVKVVAEVTPSQLGSCDNLYQLYDCYGDGTCDILKALEDFAIGLPPSV
jgi:hypothetical protein